MYAGRDSLPAGKRKIPFREMVSLMETAKVSVSLKLPEGGYTLYPLSLSGRRRSPLPLEFRDNAQHFQLDTAQLPDGVTPFFELVRR